MIWAWYLASWIQSSFGQRPIMWPIFGSYLSHLRLGRGGEVGYWIANRPIDDWRLMIEITSQNYYFVQLVITSHLKIPWLPIVLILGQLGNMHVVNTGIHSMTYSLALEYGLVQNNFMCAIKCTSLDNQGNRESRSSGLPSWMKNFSKGCDYFLHTGICLPMDSPPR